MRFEPTTLRVLVGCSNQSTELLELCGEHGSIFGSRLEPHRMVTQSSND